MITDEIITDEIITDEILQYIACSSHSFILSPHSFSEKKGEELII